MGYRPKWVIISQKRYGFYNNIQDFVIFKKASRKVELINPEIKGGVYNYLKKGFFSRRMIHVEVFN